MPEIVFARDYGIHANSKENYVDRFVRMFAEHQEDTCFILENGRYDFYANDGLDRHYILSNSDYVENRKVALAMEYMCNIVLDGNGSEFIFHGQILPLAIAECRNVTIQNLTIDWEIPLTAEGRVVSSGNGFVDVEIDAVHFPYRIREGRLYFFGEDWEEPLYRGMIEFDAAAHKVAFATGDYYENMTAREIAPNTVRLLAQFHSQPQVGNVLVIRHTKRINGGIFAENSSDLKLERITLHHTSGLGVLCQFCENINFKGIQMLPNRKRGRVAVSGHDDGLHLCNNRGQITVENCYFHGLMDDPINVHGTAVRICKQLDAHTLCGEFAHSMAMGFSNWATPSQAISFIDHESMASYATLHVRSFKLLDLRSFTISFEEPIPERISPGDALENLSNVPSFTCRDSFFGSCRARGLLVSTPGSVLIEGNTFESSGSAILIAGDANQWYESGGCKDVLIRRNIFQESCLTSDYQFCEAIISIYPEVPCPDQKLPFHKNIRIMENVFYLYDSALLYAKSTDGLLLIGNKLIRSYTYPPRYPDKKLLTLMNCTKVVISQNEVTGDLLSNEAALSGMTEEDVNFTDSLVQSFIDNNT